MLQQMFGDKLIAQSIFANQDRHDAMGQITRKKQLALSKLDKAENGESKPEGKKNGKASAATQMPSLPRQKLRRSGQLPYIFQPLGEIGFATSYTPQLPFWYELNLWFSDEQKYVLNIRRFAKSDQERDSHIVKVASSTEEVLSAIESYDPLADITVSIDFSKPMTLAEISLYGIELCGNIEIARKQYHDVVSEMFFCMSEYNA